MTSRPASGLSSTEPPSGFIARHSRTYWTTNLALFLAGFSTFSLMYCVQPLLPVLARAFQVGPAESSLALSLTTGLLALAILAAGAVSEAVGRKGLIMASLCAAAVLNIVAASAPSWTALLAGRAAEGLALGGAPAVAMAYLAEEIEPAGLGFAMGLYVAGTAFGGMAGRVVTGVAADLGGWRFALDLIGILGLSCAAGFWLLLPASRNFVRRPGVDARYHIDAWGGHLRRAGLPSLFAIGFFAMGGFVTVYNYASFRLTEPPFSLSQAAAGLIFTVYLVGMAASFSAGGLADRFGRAPVQIAGLALFAAGLALTLASSLWLVIAGVALVTAGFFTVHAVASGWVGWLAKGAKSHATSLYLLAYYLGSSLMGSLGGWFWAQAGWPGVAGFVAVLLAAAMIAALRLRRL